MTVTLAESQAHCRDVSRREARNFYYGMRLTPEPKRSAMYAIYAWMRQADDLADEAGQAGAKAERLEQFRRRTHAMLDGPREGDEAVWPALRDAVERFDIPREYLDEMIEGQLMDMARQRYATFEQLYRYCYRVASVVGLTCIEIWGYDGGEQTRQLAEWRGIAFQLTNILRDVTEDAERDRVYLPAEDFDTYEVNPSLFAFGIQPEALTGMAKTIERAADYYQRSGELQCRVHRDGRACLWAMTQIYRAIFEKIRRRPEAVLRGERVRLSGWRKGWIALRASLPGGAGS